MGQKVRVNAGSRIANCGLSRWIQSGRRIGRNLSENSFADQDALHFADAGESPVAMPSESVRVELSQELREDRAVLTIRSNVSRPRIRVVYVIHAYVIRIPDELSLPDQTRHRVLDRNAVGTGDEADIRRQRTDRRQAAANERRLNRARLAATVAWGTVSIVTALEAWNDRSVATKKRLNRCQRGSQYHCVAGVGRDVVGVGLDVRCVDQHLCR